MMGIARLAKILDCAWHDVAALRALCAVEHHKVRGVAAGICVCGANNVCPPPPACIALRRLVDIAESVEVRS